MVGFGGIFALPMSRKKIASVVGKVPAQTRAQVRELLRDWRVLADLDDALAELFEAAQERVQTGTEEECARAHDEAREAAAWRDLLVLQLDSKTNAPGDARVRIVYEWERRWMARAVPVIAEAVREHRTQQNEIPLHIAAELASKLASLWLLQHPGAPFEVDPATLSLALKAAENSLGVGGPKLAAQYVASRLGKTKKSATTAGRAAKVPRVRVRFPNTA